MMMSITDDGRRLLVQHDHSGPATLVHPIWLRERSTTSGQLDRTSLQRLYDPNDFCLDLRVVDATVDGAHVRVGFSDGHEMTMAVDRLLVELGWQPSPEATPARVPWSADFDHLPDVSWTDLVAPDNAAALVQALDPFYRYGFFILRDVPTTPGTIRDVANFFGNLIPTNFGDIFDVESKPDPTDLAYTGLHLAAHTDGPYRKPGLTIQMLHALANEAPGGDSTLVDGLAAANQLRAVDPEAFDAVCSVGVDFRYDVVTEAIATRAPLLRYIDGEFAEIRFSPRMDFVEAADADQLDAFYRGRRWLRDHLNDPANQAQFRLDAGDLMFMDNQRLLHGRTAFDAQGGQRHLQGCYIDHDGPDTLWRVACRQRDHGGAKGLADIVASHRVTLPGGVG